MKHHSHGSISMNSSQGGVLNRLLNEGSRAWNISPAALMVLWLIPVLIVAGAVVSALMGKEMYKWYTGEDQFAETIKIGIICEDSLLAVFECISISEKHFTGFLGRIERYWNSMMPSYQFPEIIYQLNSIPILNDSVLPLRKIDAHSDNPKTLQAIGCALCGVTPGIPLCSGVTSESRFRVPRTILLACALLLIVFYTLYPTFYI